MYKLLEEDPTTKYKNKLVKLLKPLKKSGKITKAAYDHLYPTAEVIPRMYCTPKIHKKDVPLRPIVDCTDAVTYNLSKALVFLLSPLLGKSKYNCKNSKELAKELATVTIEQDEQLISHDVVSLFTKTPVDATIEIVRKRLLADKTLKKRTDLNISDIMALLTFVAKSKYFRFQGKVYQQIEGFAMGDPLSAIMSNFFMEDLEDRAVPTAPEDIGLSLWKRYVDDIMEKIKRGNIAPLTDHLNTQDETGNIKFTHEEEKDGRLPFLDVKIIRKEDGTIKLQIYRKETHTDQYLMFDSHHPVQHKLSVIRTLFGRAEDIVTEPEDKAAEIQHIEKALKDCKYPQWAIDRVRKDISRPKEDKKKGRKKKHQEKQIKGMVVLPYVKGVTERIQRTMRKHNIETPVKPHITIRRLVVHPKDKLEDNHKCGVIYRVNCLSCQQIYLGETGRKLETRIKEHEDETTQVTSKPKTRSTSVSEDTTKFKSAIPEHIRSQNHLMDFENIEIVDRESGRMSRWIKEAIHIRRKEPIVMNRNEGTYNLARVWDSIICPPSTTAQGGPNHHHHHS